MDELIKELHKTVSPSQEDQNEATKFIESYIKNDLNNFLKLLSDVLYNQANPPVVRAAAGLQLKNQLTARDELIKQKQQENWRNLPAETRQYIKERVFSALGTEIFRPSSAPQCVAYIAIVELPHKQWPGLIEALVRNVTDKQSSDPIRLATLEAIGYICQDIDQSWLDPNESNSILTAIVSCMSNNSQNDSVIQAATSTLANFFNNRLKEVSKSQESITFEKLGEMLNLESRFAERVIAQMIREDHIKGHLDQIEQIVYFETKDSLQLFDQDILKFCSEINGIVEKIKRVVPNEWWF